MKSKCLRGLTLVLITCLAFVVYAATTGTSATATWDFEHVNPSGLKGLKIEGVQGHIPSTLSNINIYCIAKYGKFAQRTDDAQLNAKTTLRVPVTSTSDVVTVTSAAGYHNYNIGNVAATADVTTHQATSAEVKQGYVVIYATASSYLKSIKVSLKNYTASSSSSSSTTKTTKVSPVWDFENVNPSSLNGLKIEGTQGHIPSTVSNVDIYCIGKYGKFAQRTNDAQLNAKTTLRVPVTSTSDVVTVTSVAGYHNYNINNVAATADVTTHQATSAEVKQGYVVIYATGSSYLKSIKATLNKFASNSSSSSSSSSSSTDTGKTDNSTSGSGNFTSVSQNYYVVSAGSASSFLAALKQANSNKSNSRKYIFLPNGTYNLGTTCLTAITGSNISIIGESMNGTIIKNAPSVKNEGISTTATLLNQGNNNYFQDLTIQNALDYYNSGAAGRAVCLQDKGNYTICKNVKMLSYQDTYYSNNANGKFYFEGCDIHGTVDFICGGGDAFFNKCTLTIEKRTANGTGSCTIAAPYTQSNWGYVFNNCTIANNAQSYTYARAWGGAPKAAFINTVLNDPNRIASTRFTAQGMNVIADKFVEYRSVNTSGKVVSPSSNKVKFYKGSTSKTVETILTSTQAKSYAIGNVFGSWQPQESSAQLTVGSLTQNGNKLQWGAVKGASSYAIFKDGSFVSIVPSSTTSYNMTATGKYSVRASNPMGGFGTAASLTVTKLNDSSSSSSSSSSSDAGSTTVNGLSKYDANAPIGWATVGGNVTGSSNKNAVVVTTADELIDAMSGTDAKTIYVKGTLSFSGQVAVNGGQNKTVLGLPGSALVNLTHTASVDKTGILMLKNCKNIIMRNLTFKGAGAYDIDGKDNLTVQNCQYLWVDHCDFQDGVDGNFDLNNGSDNVAVTWCRFRYLKSPYAGGSGGSNDHRFSDLWGGSDKNASKDQGKLRTTFANCWWDEGCKERMPRVRFGQVHILNCLYSSSVANYCVGAAYRSNIYLENTAFTSSATQKYPWKRYATASGYTDYNITVKGCQGASDQQAHSGNIAFFIPSNYYKYTAYSASEVQAQVSKYAGATLSISAPTTRRAPKANSFSTTTGIEPSLAATAEAVETRYYNAQGAEVPSLQRGLNIVRTRMSDGTVKVRKVLKR